MIDILKSFSINKVEIEALEIFEPRDGFNLIEKNEFKEMQDYFGQFSVYKNIVTILTDENSNYWCLYVSGAMKGMVCYLSHDELNLEPKFKSISTLIDAIENNPDAYDFEGLGEEAFDFPSTKISAAFSERRIIIEKLFKELNQVTEEEQRQQLAFSIMALTSTEEIENNIYPFLTDENMYVQERAIQLLGFHKYLPAREKLRELTVTAMKNGKSAAATALKKLRNNRQ